MPLALVALAALVPFAALLGGAPFGDDLRFVARAPWLDLPASDFLVLVFSPAYFPLTGEGSYQPLTTLFHYVVRGPVWLHRAAGLALHAANAGLLLALGRRLGLRAPAALAAALLFAVYPTHTETLAVSAFKGHLLAAFFTLAALLCWSRALETGRGRPAEAAFACMALALLSKETGLLAPALLAAYSLALAPSAHRRLQRRAAAAAAALVAAYLWWRFGVLRQAGLADPVRISPAVVLGWYAARLAWPLPLCREHVPPTAAAWTLGAAALAAAAWALRSRPRALFGLALAALGLLPFVAAAGRYADSPVADRYLYLPAAGLALALADLLAGRASPAALAALGALWAGASAQRSLLMREPGRLYEQTARCAPEHPKAWGVLSAHHLEEGRRGEAERCARRALELAPDYPGARAVLEQALRR
jgi:hypothetical protein